MNFLKRSGLLLGILAIVIVIYIAADHTDAPAVAGTSSDIADFYAFQGENTGSTVFIVTLPASDASSNFDENVLIEINIDNTGVDDPSAPGVTEDLVMQAIRQGDNMYFFGPYAPGSTGLSSTIDESQLVATVPIGETVETGGARYFAGLRQDAFFFDFNAFNDVIGNAPIAGFGDDGENAFAGANVNAIVVEIPNTSLGSAPAHIVDQLLGTSNLPTAYNVWVETKRR